MKTEYDILKEAFDALPRLECVSKEWESAGKNIKTLEVWYHGDFQIGFDFWENGKFADIGVEEV